MRKLLGLLNLGVTKWIAVAGAVIIIGLAWTCHYQREQIKEKNDALAVAGERLRQAAKAIRTRDNLIFSTAQDGGQSVTQVEKECKDAVLEAYDAGRESALPDGVRGSFADRANRGAFEGTVSGKSAR